MISVYGLLNYFCAGQIQDFYVGADPGFLCSGQIQDFCAWADLGFMCRGQMQDLCMRRA